MDNVSLSSEEEDEGPKGLPDKLDFKTKIDAKPNEDTARFLVEGREREPAHTKYTLEYPSLEDEEEEAEEDSEDYF